MHRLGDQRVNTYLGPNLIDPGTAVRRRIVFCIDTRSAILFTGGTLVSFIDHIWIDEIAIIEFQDARPANNGLNSTIVRTHPITNEVFLDVETAKRIILRLEDPRSLIHSCPQKTPIDALGFIVRDDRFIDLVHDIVVVVDWGFNPFNRWGFDYDWPWTEGAMQLAIEMAANDKTVSIVTTMWEIMRPWYIELTRLTGGLLSDNIHNSAMLLSELLEYFAEWRR